MGAVGATLNSGMRVSGWKMLCTTEAPPSMLAMPAVKRMVYLIAVGTRMAVEGQQVAARESEHSDQVTADRALSVTEAKVQGRVTGRGAAA
eukprot:CAMPEP_0173291874 /NCGR_PEP_ID=MMETSP1143-20121109/12409_1 /TAXON_ID=483371 /ORGANISM="non described non described, Strain CCMP2298" /LENGTH=90 /DNA_ID=CAMNT_0014231187 /DNA_START=172 /DNA_END=441 /DNA_ORIENTATION=-